MKIENSIKEKILILIKERSERVEEKIELSILLSLYGNLLTETQQKYMDLYYNEDYSLSEIGDNENITRQAVRTILLKSKNKLYEYEKKLGFYKKEKEIKKIIEKLQKTTIDKKANQYITHIIEKLDF